MGQLNFPNYAFKIKVINEKRYIFDRLRKKYVALQPEELVRQHMVEYLIQEKNYKASLISNETALTYNGMQKRCDTVVYGTNGQPIMIIEYKAPTVEISQKTFDQIVLYNSQLQVKYLLISNGLKHFCCKINFETMTHTFLDQVPNYEELIADKQ